MYCYQLCLKLNCRPKIKWQVVPLTASRLGNSKMLPSFFLFPCFHSSMEGVVQHIRFLCTTYMYGFLKVARSTEAKQIRGTQRLSVWITSILRHTVTQLRSCGQDLWRPLIRQSIKCLWLDRASALLWGL